MVSTMDAHRFLQIAPIFEGLGLEALRGIMASGCFLRAVARGTCLFREGDPTKELYVLASGRIQIVQTISTGHRLILQFARPGAAFDLATLLARWNGRHTVGACARDDSSVWIASIDEFRRHLDAHPVLLRNVAKILSGEAEALRERVRDFALLPVERRIARILLSEYRVSGPEVQASHAELAEMGGTTRSTVSRLLGRWRGEGVIETGRESVVVLSPDSLELLAEGAGEA